MGNFHSQIITFDLFPFVCHADTTAQLTLKKIPTEDRTFTLNIYIKDNAGMGVPQAFKGELIL